MEDILTGTDVIPTFTLMGFYTYFLKKRRKRNYLYNNFLMLIKMKIMAE
jgi:hypothetical protein